MTSRNAANVFFEEKKENGTQMKLKTNDTKNRQVVCNKSGRSIVLYEVMHAKCKFHDCTKVKL